MGTTVFYVAIHTKRHHRSKKKIAITFAFRSVWIGPNPKIAHLNMLRNALMSLLNQVRCSTVLAIRTWQPQNVLSCIPVHRNDPRVYSATSQCVLVLHFRCTECHTFELSESLLYRHQGCATWWACSLHSTLTFFTAGQCSFSWTKHLTVFNCVRSQKKVMNASKTAGIRCITVLYFGELSYVAWTSSYLNRWNRLHE